jgi:hypothetical protein
MVSTANMPVMPPPPVEDDDDESRAYAAVTRPAIVASCHR